MQKRLVLGLTCLTLLFVFLFVTNNALVIKVVPFLRSSEDYGISRYVDSSTIYVVKNFSSNSLKNQNDMPLPGRGIFFHETSLFGDEGIVLTAREACAVESAAMMNPKMTIYLLVVSSNKISNVTRQTIKHLTSYDNVKIRRIFMDDYVKNTPLEDWYASGILNTSQWPRSHMSDILRYLTLWKFGGIYLDLDVVVTTTLDGLTNFAGAQDEFYVAAGVMGLSTTGLGRQIANACIHDLKTNFRGDAWANNGPGVITRVLEKLCATKDAQSMNDTNCHGFKVFPPSIFYPISYPAWRLYFDLDQTNETMKLIENARAIHVWNKLSSKESIKVGSKVPYAIVAKKYCPKIYDNCGKTF